jgi:hypothetical protein
MPERAGTTGGPITIDRTSAVPLYYQLAQHFESAIPRASTTTLPAPSAIPH